MLWYFSFIRPIIRSNVSTSKCLMLDVSMLKDLYDFNNRLIERGVFFCFCGPVTQNLVREIGSALEKKMKMLEAKKPTILRVFSMVVETAQNIMYYSAEKDSNEMAGGANPNVVGLGVITVGHEAGTYFVISGNMIDNDKVPKLREKLERLKSLKKSELKKLFKEQLKKGPEAGSKGAGVGFIEMAKKSSKPIDFHFQEINERQSFFSIKISI